MANAQVFEQSISIGASATLVERCITEQDLMHQWLNPLLKCEPVGKWDMSVGARSRFMIQIPVLQPTLDAVVIQREPGLIVWGFEGFFKGRDRWECQPLDRGTLLLNRFKFEIPNPWVEYGFKVFASRLTQADMQAQLRRLKKVAEALHQKSAE